MNVTPGKAIHRHCVSCVEHAHEVKYCQGDKMIGGQGNKNGICYFFTYRLGRGRPSVKVIRRFCLECHGDSRKSVRDCPSKKCHLYIYRMGTNPARAGVGNKKAIAPPLRLGFLTQNRRSPPDEGLSIKQLPKSGLGSVR